MKKLHGNIGFHIANGSDGKRPYVRITDRLSGEVILEAELSFEDYAEGILTLRHDVPCFINFNDDGPIGKKREYKEELVWIPRAWELTEEQREREVRHAVGVKEVDGWMGSDEDARNSHNWTRKAPPPGLNRDDGVWMRITYVRYVEPTKQDINNAAKARF
jgi:hypothetical protein